MKKRIPKASIIIVDFHKGKQVLEAVQSIQSQQVNCSIDVVVFDNSCCDHNAKILKTLDNTPNVSVMIAPENRGYSLGNNIAAQKVQGEVLFFMNPDIVLSDPHTLQKMIDAMIENPEAVIMGPGQRTHEGKRENTARRFPTLMTQIARRTILQYIPPFRQMVTHYEYRDIAYNAPQEVDWLQSSFWAVRRSFWKKNKGFHEGLFVFMADTELCRRAMTQGKKVIYLPQIEVETDGVRASDGGILSIYTKKSLRIHILDAWRYYSL